MKKDAGVAALLNTIDPGFGWIYCEYILIGIVSIVIDVVLFYMSVLHSDIVCSVIYLIFWIISINWVCNAVNGKSIALSFIRELFLELK